MDEGVALSDVLIGDLVTPHSPTDAFTYVASVVLLDGSLRQVPLPEALGEYPSDPEAVRLDGEQLAGMRAAAVDTDTIEDLLSRVDEDTFIPYRECGVDNLRAYVAEHAPELLGDSALGPGSKAELPAGTLDGSPLLVVLVVMLLALLLGAGSWVVVRVVSGF